jgi:penicillin amidase
MTPATSQRLRLLASVLTVLLGLALLAGGGFYLALRSSLPPLDGAHQLTGLSAPVAIERDALGVPTIRAASRMDAARALGWLHGQDRFFQMDLLRRNAAGELSVLVGARALPRDRAHRRHGFRAVAEKALARLPAAERALLEAYAAGVNAGLASLGARPFEYLVQRVTPEPWTPVDSMLAIYSMTLDLQDNEGRRELTRMTLRDQFGLEGLAFFDPTVTSDDVALDGSTAPTAPIPSARILNIRPKKTAGWTTPDRGPESFPFLRPDSETVVGSNAFAVAGARSATGGALLAGDMHLGLNVPGVWYRVQLEWQEGSVARRLVGAGLPGMPVVVVGSNGRVAWAFTNSQIDVADLVVVEQPSGLEEWYHAPGQADDLKLETRTEVIRVKGGDDVRLETKWTIWGPLVGKDEQGRALALRWTMHDPAAADLRILGLESADNVAAAVAAVRGAGAPALNCVLADRDGEIAWTIVGRIPDRRGFDGRLPVSWMYGDRTWRGLLAPEQTPAVATHAERIPGAIAAQDGFVWSANQRQIGGTALKVLGDGGYARPYRAAQIREGLARLTQATPHDLLKIQLDDRAQFQAFWHAQLMTTLTADALAQQPARARLKAAVEKWEGRASIDAVSYRLVREFRLAVQGRMFRPIFAGCVEANPKFNWSNLALEPATRALLQERPMHLLAPEYASWDQLLLAAADEVIEQMERQNGSLAKATWGRRNTLQMKHPFAAGLPGWLPNWLGMPAEQLPGSEDMPNAQTPNHGASQRMVVAPGREQEGIYHQPGGQSGHPLSPYFRAGHAAWVKGEPTPLLPGPAQHQVKLVPAQASGS